MSATLNAAKFCAYFSGAPHLELDGRAYDVDGFFLKESPADYVLDAFSVVMYIHDNKPQGDLLVFLPSSTEIEELCGLIKRHGGPMLHPFPLYRNASKTAREAVLGRIPAFRGRKCGVATNIAETSLTINGVSYVIDTGLSMQNVYNPRTNTWSLRTLSVSRASIKQHLGRAGRTGPGEYYGLYPQEAIRKAVLPISFPGILTEQVEDIVLRVKKAGFGSIMELPLIDKPHPETVLRALQNLSDW